ncbi:FAD-dependent oxidoreductase [Maritalea mediterranea]|uniref:FAD-dependent oxidoreductase n=1 Tax=Maritalea mediterranea TaxID=2909667 RepID=A0ABS9E365_9HYPH|nr:FAD-dependent oxidoreductase [Maritalea mediterranea]
MAQEQFAQDGPRVAIIGAGIVGVTTALRLKELGAYPIILDAAEDAATATSAQNAAQLSYTSVDSVASPDLLSLIPSILMGQSPSAKLSPLWVKDYFSWALKFLTQAKASQFEKNSLANLELSMASKAVFAEWLEKYEFEFDYRASGKLTVLGPKANLTAAQLWADKKKKLGAEIEVLDHEGAVRKEPTFIQFQGRCKGGIYSPGDSVGDARKFAREALRHLVETGTGKFLPNHRVLDVVMDQQEMRHLITDQGRVEADAFVICAGLQSVDLCARLGKKLPLAPMAGYSLSLPMGKAVPDVAITDSENKAVVTRLGDRIRYAGYADFVPAQRGISAKRLNTFKARLFERFPLVALDEGDLSPWMGFRPLTPDSQPVIGRLTQKNGYINTGHGMFGWILSAGSADRVARQIIREVK